MPKFKFHVEQSFSCTYVVEGETLQEAWNSFKRDREGECIEQYPEDITTELSQAGVAVSNEQTDEWEDLQ